MFTLQPLGRKFTMSNFSMFCWWDDLTGNYSSTDMGVFVHHLTIGKYSFLNAFLNGIPLRIIFIESTNTEKTEMLSSWV